MVTRRDLLRILGGTALTAAAGGNASAQNPQAEAQSKPEPKVIYDPIKQVLTLNLDSAELDVVPPGRENAGLLTINGEIFKHEELKKDHFPIKTIVPGPKMGKLIMHRAALWPIRNLQEDQPLMIDNPSGNCEVEIHDDIVRRLNPFFAFLNQKEVPNPYKADEKPVAELAFELNEGSTQSSNSKLLVRNPRRVRFGLSSIQFDPRQNDPLSIDPIVNGAYGTSFVDRLTAGTQVDRTAGVSWGEGELMRSIWEAKHMESPLYYRYEGRGENYAIKGVEQGESSEITLSVAPVNHATLTASLFDSVKIHCLKHKKIVLVSGDKGNINIADLTELLQAASRDKEISKRVEVDGAASQAKSDILEKNEDAKGPTLGTRDAKLFLNVGGVELQLQNIQQIQIGNERLDIPFAWEKNKAEKYERIEDAVRNAMGREKAQRNEWQKRHMASMQGNQGQIR